jgi:uracil-DNA glycosylase
MNLIDRLGEWYQFFDKPSFSSTLNILRRKYNQGLPIMPDSHVIFKAFECTPIDCNVIICGMDPYPQKGISTGIAFGNDLTKQVKISPSLDKLLEPLKVDNTFDYTLQSWCKQGVLMLNSTLTVVQDKPSSHQLLWRPFITSFLKNYSTYNQKAIWVLLGKSAQSLKPYILYNGNIMECSHPSYLVREKIPMPNIYQQINSSLIQLNKPIIRWYD